MEIEQCMKSIYIATEFQQVADSLQLSVGELSDYPVIFPIRKPERISSGFGIRVHPVYKLRKFHKGIDIVAAKGTPVYATGNGIVTRKGYNSGYGYYIEIQHAGGFRSFYAHLSRTLVDVGYAVGIADQIACVGNTGISTGSHLHYEVRKGIRYLNPIQWCYCLSEIISKEDKMKFIKTYLQPDEEVKYRARIHIFLFLQPAILLGIGLMCYLDSVSITHYLGVTLLFLGLVSLVQRVLVKIGSIYAVTNKRVILKTGVVSRRAVDLVLAKCEGIQVTQDILGRIFGYGSIVVTTGGATNCYYYVANPLRFKQAINEQISAFGM